MSLITDMSTLTTIPVLSLEKLVEKEELCILHKILENEKKGEPITIIDLEFGSLYIKHENDELKYKFIPSKAFEKKLKHTIQTNESPLVEALEDTLKDKIVNAYKDLF